MITIDEAKKLTYRTVIYHNTWVNSDGTPARWRVNGKVKLWKRSPERIKVPLARGLWEHDYLTEDNLCDFCLDEADAKEQHDARYSKLNP